MSEQMSLEDYKQKVRECLMMNPYRTTEGAEKLMKLYEDDFPEFLADKWEPSAVAAALIMGA